MSLTTKILGTLPLLALASFGNLFAGCASDNIESANGGNDLKGVVPDDEAVITPTRQQSCNGPLDQACPATHYCNSLTCSAPGQCLPKPESCSRIDLPVCGCDGNTYESACEAQRAGVGVSAHTACAPIPFDPVPVAPERRPIILPMNTL